MAATKKSPAKSAPAKTSAAKSGARGKSAPQSKKSAPAAKAPPPKRREIGALVCLCLAVFSFIGFFTAEGWFIDFFRVFMRGLLGPGFYLLPPALLLCAVILGFHRGRPVQMRVTCTLLVPVVFGALMHLLFCRTSYAWGAKLLGELYRAGAAHGSGASGGIVGGLLALVFRQLFSAWGAAIVFICLLVFLVLTALSITPASIAAWYRGRPKREYEYIPDPEPEPEPEPEPKKTRRARGVFDAETEKELPPSQPRKPMREAVRSGIDIPVDDPPQLAKSETKIEPEPEPVGEKRKSRRAQAEEAAPPFPAPAPVAPTVTPREPLEAPPVAKPEPTKMTKEEAAAATEEVAGMIEQTLADTEGEGASYVYPPLDLLSELAPNSMVDGSEEVRANAQRLSATLRSFGINAEISNVTRGPSVTRYEVELEQGVKLAKLTNLANDIALSLGASGVRIAPVPDKISIVGIEVPNKLTNIVSLRELIESREFQSSSSKLSFAIGKDIASNAVVGDISKLPHLLIAGTTGSGKSVCMNSLILSLLYKSSPDEVRLIMVDPKMIELGVYNGIPHLLIPVVTDPKKAAAALQWAVTEMMKRYRLFSEIGARNLKSYNDAKGAAGEATLPQIVVLIDELADLMLVAAKDVEESICRVAQMGRAAGIHLIIATQRPSADVITGLMKANIPSRIAFAVDSALNSRIILDTTGAEKLVGKGDMLYAPLGAGKPRRVQGTFVTDEEREAVIRFVKERSSAQYASEVIAEIEKSAEDKDAPSAENSGGKSAAGEMDELLPEAVEILLEVGQASVSMLQRRLKLGYSRAARLVDQMEERGIVGPFEGSKPRQLLITRAQWYEMQGITPPEEPEPPFIVDDTEEAENTEE